MKTKKKLHNISELPLKKSGLQICELTKAYGSQIVLDHLSLNLQPDNIYCLMAPSGSGKTTLFRILLGLETADSGQIYGLEHMRLSSVFQEDRLLEGYTAQENLRFVTGFQYSSKELDELLLQLLPPEALKKPVHEFSGGMKRRTAILRALLVPSDLIIMDEPFTGLDSVTKQTVINLIKTYAKGKLLLISTHNKEEVSLLSAKLLFLEKQPSKQDSL